jgi:hypothetical protein
LAALDVNRDGKITLKEWTDSQRDPAQFAMLDANKDGVFDAAEQSAQRVFVVDMRDPAKPVEVRSVPVLYGSESFRVVVNSERAVMVSGSSVYDIKDCLNPVLKGEIKWPPTAIGVSPPMGGGGGTGNLPHDFRINHAGTKVYAAMGLWEVDISNLNDPTSWKITDDRCDVATQVPGPWQEIHRQARKYDLDLCEDAAKPATNYRMAGGSAQSMVTWPTLSHSPDISGDDKRVFIADQAGGAAGKIRGNQPYMHIVDVSQHPVKVLGEVKGPGHGLDWFRAGGREYVAHSNEIGTGGFGSFGAAPAQGRGGQAGPAAQGGAPGRGGLAGITSNPVNVPGDTCQPYPRPTALGWAFEVIVTDVTDPTKPRNLSMLQIAINNPENCAARKASGKDPTIAYHLIDDAMDAHFAAVNFGSAGLRIYDIRNPAKPSEVAYYNHGPLVHAGVGYYDAARGLIYAAGSSGFWVLELEPQVRARLGI